MNITQSINPDLPKEIIFMRRFNIIISIGLAIAGIVGWAMFKHDIWGWPIAIAAYLIFAGITIFGAQALADPHREFGDKIIVAALMLLGMAVDCGILAWGYIQPVTQVMAKGEQIEIHQMQGNKVVDAALGNQENLSACKDRKHSWQQTECENNITSNNKTLEKVADNKEQQMDVGALSTWKSMRALTDMVNKNKDKSEFLSPYEVMTNAFFFIFAIVVMIEKWLWYNLGVVTQKFLARFGNSEGNPPPKGKEPLPVIDTEGETIKAIGSSTAPVQIGYKVNLHSVGLAPTEAVEPSVATDSVATEYVGNPQFTNNVYDLFSYKKAAPTESVITEAVATESVTTESVVDENDLDKLRQALRERIAKVLNTPVKSEVACPNCGNKFKRQSRTHYNCSNSKNPRQDGGNCADEVANFLDPKRQEALNKKHNKKGA